jgi:Fe-S cluster assembly protein SufD
VNAAAEAVLAEQAVFQHYDIQKASSNLRIVQRTEVAQKKHSNYSNYTFTFPGASFVRNNLALHLNDADVESHLYGLYLSADTQLVDNHTEVHHKMPRGESNQLYKGIVMDKSRAVFNGKIFVYQDAQKTNAFQQSNNVLFSEQATVNAKPQLEIFADDVKCSHGTTIGQLNKEALFYLKSRGIGEAQAKQLMVKAFAYDVAEKIQIESLRAYIESMIEMEMESR